MSSLASVLDEARKLTPAEQRELVATLLAENRQPSTADERKPLWDKIKERSAQVPFETWADAPPDGALNVDHYLYGVPKRQP